MGSNQSRPSEAISNRPSHALRLGATLSALAVLIASPYGAAPAWALTYTPTDVEWATWPEYCRARYTVSGSGKASQFRSYVAPDAVQRWEIQMGPAWEYLHHHCYALSLVSQARSESSPQKRRFALESAIVEDRFMLDSSASTAHPMFGAVMTHIGLVYRQLNQVPEAETAFDQSIARFPAYAGAYQGKALLLRDLKKYESARDTLLEGIKAASEPSAELHYFLGLVYVDLKEYPLAKQQAIAAYSLGYPLPGLRDKLRKAGYPLS